jgi:hypothetical protein
VGGSIAGQVAVIYAPPLQAVFQTVPLSAGDWVYILAIASTVLLTDELRKALNAARVRNQPLLPALLSRLCGSGRKRLRYGYARMTGSSSADDYKRTDGGGGGSPRRV